MFPNLQVRLSDELTDGKGYGHVHSGGSFPGGGSNMSMMINKSIGLPPNMAPKSRLSIQYSHHLKSLLAGNIFISAFKY